MMEEKPMMDDLQPTRENSTEAINLITENTINGNIEKRDSGSPYNAPQNLNRGSSHLANRPASSRTLGDNLEAAFSSAFSSDPEDRIRSSIPAPSYK